MRRQTRSWPATLRKFCGTSPPNLGHQMSMNSDPVVSTGSMNVSVLDGGLRRRKTDWPVYGPLDERPADTIRLAVIGYGYWGPNIVRNLHNLEKCEVAAVCDKNQ